MLRKIFKWFFICIGILILIIVIAVFVLKSNADKRINKSYSITPQKIKIPDDSASHERGGYLAHVLCAECHGGSSFAGMNIFDDPKIGRVNSPNLTRGLGGIGSDYSDEDWVRVLRNGIKPDGKGVFVMPSADFNAMSASDLGSIIAYMKTIPPVDKEWERKSELTVFGKVLLAVGAFGNILAAETIDHTARAEEAPQAGPTEEYGNYMVKIFGCRTCHGINLNGGKDPNPKAPFAPNLTRGGLSGKWNLVEFRTAMRTGKTPDERQLSDFMPWKAMTNMSDDDLEAVYRYLHSLPDLQTASN
ncbi:MAG: c-type cytochrome [Bacteroidetes bacterium]|nr:c-type cytochrome [Bacteroidota bacterium]